MTVQPADYQALVAALAEEKQRRQQLEKVLAHKLRELHRNQQLQHQHELQLLAQEKLASIGSLAAGLAHELNTPNGYIKCNLQMLLKDWQLLQQYFELVDKDPKAAASFYQQNNFSFMLQDGTDLVDESLQGLNHIASIIKDLRAFAEEQSDLTGVLDLRDCVEQTLDLLEFEGVLLPQVHVQLDPVPRLPGDPEKIRLAVMHLLNNASQAAGPDGQIWLHLYQPVADEIELSIRDSGDGVPPELMARIFDPFFTTRPVGQGRGMGLSITRMIMTQHSGQVLVESLQGQGACFRLRFPYKPHVARQ